jgi:diguanylate cyclase (GGDEF)-like protein
METHPFCTSRIFSCHGVFMSVDGRLDPETGLYTKHFFGMLFNHEITRTHRYPCPMVLLRIATRYNSATDDDKTENPTTSVARTLFHSVRQVDVSAQFGDDYLVLLPATDEKGGTIVGNRLLKRLRSDYPSQTGERLPVAIYIGMATHSGGPGASAEAILVQASEALEEARQRGSNALVNFREISTLDL